MSNEITIELGGQKIGLLFDLPATEWLNDHVKMKNVSGAISMTVNQFAYLLEGGYKNYCMAEGIDDSIPHRQFYNYALSRIKANDEELAKIIKAYTQANKVEDIPSLEVEEKKSLSPSTGGRLKSFVSGKEGITPVPLSATM